ncbi:MAG TPA: anthranilate phosphoribosyltransferase [Bacteroidota bacterium]|nr:anthranilate phosphoribosyltransferase [Bacteroidota bacterium]
MKEFIEKCLSGENLTMDEAARALDLIMTGQASDVQIAGLLVALRAKGESIDELVGFARTMRKHAVKVNVDDEDAIDVCGTGGDSLGTFNISTMAAFVIAGAGVTVAKHGNKSVSSKSGSADLLTALGVNIQCPPAKVEECINTVGVGFLFAPMFHPAMKFAAKTRSELGIRTIFNLLGPITNPAGVKKQLIGTFQPAVATKLAGTVEKLSTDMTCVVHSKDGLDEVTLSGETSVHEVEKLRGARHYSVDPTYFGLPSRPLSSLRGGSPQENASIAVDVLNKNPGPARDVVIANAAFGLYVAGKARDLHEGSRMAARSIDSGSALDRLNRMIAFTGR